MKGKKYGGNKSKINRETFVEAVKKTGGIKTIIARNLDVSTRQLYRWLETNKEFAEPYINEEFVKVRDVAKNNVFSAIVEGDLNTSRWFLTSFDEYGKIHRQTINETININQQEISFNMKLNDAEKLELLNFIDNKES